jgi:hypothetical protein
MLAQKHILFTCHNCFSQISCKRFFHSCTFLCLQVKRCQYSFRDSDEAANRTPLVYSVQQSAGTSTRRARCLRATARCTPPWGARALCWPSPGAALVRLLRQEQALGARARAQTRCHPVSIAIKLIICYKFLIVNLCVSATVILTWWPTRS